MVMSKAKWLVPLIVIVAMLAAVGIVWGQSGSSNDGGIIDVTDFNPAYDDQLVIPSEDAGIQVLYTIAIDPATSLIPLGSGTIATITLTNNIEAPLVNGTQIASTVAKLHGDIVGDLVVSADVYNLRDVTGCLVSYTATNSTSEMIAYGGTPTGMPSRSTQIVKIYPNVTVHPGGTVTFQVPISGGAQAIVGANFMIKASLAMPGTAGVTPGDLDGTPWAVTPLVGSTVTGP